jgi:WbqC-like protein family
MTTLVVLQPGYIPWLGFFDQLKRCDVFIYYDDVQFDKHGWRNRNRIKTLKGAKWLTVPVKHTGRTGQHICDVEIDRNQRWSQKHLRSIRESYARAAYLEHYYEELASTLDRDWRLLVELDIAVVALMCRWLGLERRMLRSSELDVAGGKTDRLVNLCRHVDADRYLSGTAARDYLDTGLFAAADVAVEWQDYVHPTYPQLHGTFVPFLSTLDLLFNVGPSSHQVIACGETCAPARND